MPKSEVKQSFTTATTFCIYVRRSGKMSRRSQFDKRYKGFILSISIFYLIIFESYNGMA